MPWLKYAVNETHIFQHFIHLQNTAYSFSVCGKEGLLLFDVLRIADPSK